MTGSAPGSWGDRQADDHRDAAARSVLDRELAADCVDESPRDREPEPDARVARSVAEALERLEHMLSLRRRYAAPAVDDPHVDPAGHRRRFDADGDVPARVPHRVVDDVRDRALQQRRVDVRRAAGSPGTSTTTSRARSLRLANAAGTISSSSDGRHASWSAPDCSRLMSSRFSTSLCSRVCFGVDAEHEVAGVGAGPVDVGLQPSGCQRFDRRQRRAQIVAHCGEQRVAQVVRLREAARPCSLPLANAASPRSPRGTRATPRRVVVRRRAAVGRSSRARWPSLSS